MIFKVDVEVERSEGKNVGKDYLAEDFESTFDGETIGIIFEDEVDEEETDQFDIQSVKYLGTRKGKPLSFEVYLTPDSNFVDELENGLREAAENVGNLSFEDSTYDIIEVNVYFVRSGE